MVVDGMVDEDRERLMGWPAQHAFVRSWLTSSTNVNRATMCFLLFALCFLLFAFLPCTLRVVDATRKFGWVDGIRAALPWHEAESWLALLGLFVTLSVTLEKVFCLLN